MTLDIGRAYTLFEMLSLGGDSGQIKLALICFVATAEVRNNFSEVCLGLVPIKLVFNPDNTGT